MSKITIPWKAKLGQGKQLRYLLAHMLERA